VRPQPWDLMLHEPRFALFAFASAQALALLKERQISPGELIITTRPQTKDDASVSAGCGGSSPSSSQASEEEGQQQSSSGADDEAAPDAHGAGSNHPPPSEQEMQPSSTPWVSDQGSTPCESWFQQHASPRIMSCIITKCKSKRFWKAFSVIHY
jgi:hypothetical protein